MTSGPRSGCRETVGPVFPSLLGVKSTDERSECSERRHLSDVLVGDGYLVHRVDEAPQAVVVVVVAEVRQARRLAGSLVEVRKAIHSLPRCRALWEEPTL